MNSGVIKLNKRREAQAKESDAAAQGLKSDISESRRIDKAKRP